MGSGQGLFATISSMSAWSSVSGTQPSYKKKLKSFSLTMKSTSAGFAVPVKAAWGGLPS